MLSVLSVSARQETHRIIKNTLLTHSSYRLLGQFFNSVDAVAISSQLKPDIIILSDKMYFIGVQNFIHMLTMRGVHATYIILNNHTLSELPVYDKSLVQIQLREIEINEDAILSALKDADKIVNEKKNLQNIKKGSIDTDESWMNESHLFAKLINKQLQKNDTEFSLIQNGQGYLLVVQLIRANRGHFSFFQDLAQTDYVYKSCKAMLEFYHGGNVFFLQEDKLCLWFCPSVSNQEQLIQILNGLKKQMVKLFEYEGSCYLAFQCSDHCLDIDDFPDEYRALNRIAEYRFFTDYDTILSSKWLKENSKSVPYSEILKQFESMEQCLGSTDIVALRHYIDILFHYAQTCLSFNTYFFIWNQFIFWYNSNIQKYGLSISHFELNVNANSFDSIKSAKTYMEESILQLFSAVVNQRATYNPYIEKAISYMKEHINENISLALLADIIHVNPSYLSTLFRQETGKTFVNVRAEIKIEYAKELLKKKCKICEAAQTVGFENEKYFSRAFRRITGMSPREYQLSEGKNEKCKTNQ